MKFSLGAAMVGGGGTRRQDDFYPTPREAVAALFWALPAHWPARVWEPACGDGAISRFLEVQGVEVISTDLVYRGFGVGDIDFLACDRALAPAIVTNPPFALAERFPASRLGAGD